MMRKLLLLFISIFIFSLTSCDIINIGSSSSSSEETKNETESTEAPTLDSLYTLLDDYKNRTKLTITEETSVKRNDGSEITTKRISNVDTNKNYMHAKIINSTNEGYTHLKNGSYYYRLMDKSSTVPYTKTNDAYEAIGISSLFNIRDFRLNGNIAKVMLTGSSVSDYMSTFINVNNDLAEDFTINPSILRISIEFNKNEIKSITLDMEHIFASYLSSCVRIISFSDEDFSYDEISFDSGDKYYLETGSTLDTYVIEMIREYSDSIFIESGEFDMLIDAGQREDRDNVKEMLDTHVTDGVLDVLIVTHGHADHVGGIEAGCLKDVKVNMIIDYGYQGNDYRYQDFRENFGGEYYTAYDCVNMKNGAYKIFNFSDDLSLEILDTGQYTPFGSMPPENENDPSVTCKLTFGENTYLYTGDLSGYQYEKSLSYEDISDITVYKAAHHGSTTHGSNTQWFLDYINPEICVVSAAIKNSDTLYEQFHPTKSFVSRILRAPRISKSKNLYYNGTMGTIHLTDDGKNTPTVAGLGAKKGYYINGAKVTGEENKKFVDTQFYKHLY